MSATNLEELFAPEVDSIESSEPASHAKRRMDTNETRSILVMEQGRLVGLLRRNDLLDVDAVDLEKPISAFTIPDVPRLRKDQSIEEAHGSLHGDINIEQLPVVDEDGNLVGVVNRSALAALSAQNGGAEQNAAPHLPLEEGMSVKDSDGSSLGKLTGVEFKNDGNVAYLTVEHGLIFKKQKRLPGDVVDRVDDGDLILSIGSIEFGMISNIGEE